MIPLRDINPTATRPVVNQALIALNVAAFLMLATLPGWYETGYSLVPSRISSDPLGEAFTLITSQFLHANLAHIVGNLWFLYIFGDNVEDALGHQRYLGFYLASGIAAGLCQVAVDPASPIPMVGASGAIAGVTAAYMVLYPRAPVLVLNPILPLWLLLGPTLVFPAWLIAAEFFIMNLLMGVQSLGAQASGGVAFFAHLGGFVFGLFLVRPLLKARERREPRTWQGWRPPPGGHGSTGRGRRRDPWRPPDRWH